MNLRQERFEPVACSAPPLRTGSAPRVKAGARYTDEWTGAEVSCICSGTSSALYLDGRPMTL